MADALGPIAAVCCVTLPLSSTTQALEGMLLQQQLHATLCCLTAAAVCSSDMLRAADETSCLLSALRRLLYTLMPVQQAQCGSTPAAACESAARKPCRSAHLPCRNPTPASIPSPASRRQAYCMLQLDSAPSCHRPRTDATHPVSVTELEVLAIPPQAADTHIGPAGQSPRPCQ